MPHRLYSDCRCYNNCPEKDTAGCRYRQAENQVKELLLERKVLRDPVAARLNAKEAEQTPTNTGSPTIARRIQLLLDEWDEYAPDQKAVLADILRELQRAGA